MPDQPQIPEAAKSAAYEALGIGDNPRLKRESTAARINERTRVDVALKFAEREYERVCEERDAARDKLNRFSDGLQNAQRRAREAEAKLAQVREAALDDDGPVLLTLRDAVGGALEENEVIRDSEGKELIPNDPISEDIAAAACAVVKTQLLAILNDSDSTEVDNG